MIPVSSNLAAPAQELCSSNIIWQSDRPSHVYVDMMHIDGDVYASACNATHVEQDMVTRAVTISCASGKKIYIDTSPGGSKK